MVTFTWSRKPSLILSTLVILCLSVGASPLEAMTTEQSKRSSNSLVVGWSESWSKDYTTWLYYNDFSGLTGGIVKDVGVKLINKFRYDLNFPFLVKLTVLNPEQIKAGKTFQALLMVDTVENGASLSLSFDIGLMVHIKYFDTLSFSDKWCNLTIFRYTDNINPWIFTLPLGSSFYNVWTILRDAGLGIIADTLMSQEFNLAPLAATGLKIRFAYSPILNLTGDVITKPVMSGKGTLLSPVNLITFSKTKTVTLDIKVYDDALGGDPIEILLNPFDYSLALSLLSTFKIFCDFTVLGFTLGTILNYTIHQTLPIFYGILPMTNGKIFHSPSEPIPPSGIKIITETVKPQQLILNLEGISADEDLIMLTFSLKDEIGRSITGGRVILEINRQIYNLHDQGDGTYTITLDATNFWSLKQIIINAEKQGYLPANKYYTIFIRPSKLTELENRINNLSIQRNILITTTMIFLGISIYLIIKIKTSKPNLNILLNSRMFKRPFKDRNYVYHLT